MLGCWQERSFRAEEAAPWPRTPGTWGPPCSTCPLLWPPKEQKRLIKTSPLEFQYKWWHRWTAILPWTYQLYGYTENNFLREIQKIAEWHLHSRWMRKDSQTQGDCHPLHRLGSQQCLLHLLPIAHSKSPVSPQKVLEHTSVPQFLPLGWTLRSPGFDSQGGRGPAFTSPTGLCQMKKRFLGCRILQLHTWTKHRRNIENIMQFLLGRDFIMYFSCCCLRAQVPINTHVGADRDPPLYCSGTPSTKAGTRNKEHGLDHHKALRAKSSGQADWQGSSPPWDHLIRWGEEAALSNA